MRSKTLKIPPATTYLYKVISAIRKHGPMTIADTVPLIRGLAIESARNAFSNCRDNGLLTCEKHLYSLTAFTQRYFDECEGVQTEPIPAPEIVPPRTAPEFHPISAKYIPSAKANRPDAGPVHEVGYINGSVATNDVFRGIGLP